MKQKQRILMAAAENDALPGAKIGGVGDVIRDLPKALIQEGVVVDTVIPSYGFLARLDGLENIGGINVKFSSRHYYVDVLRKSEGADNADHYIIHHSEFSRKGECIYNDDEDHRPFASDAIKFAFFCSCVAQAITDNLIPKPNVLHCHDWHTAFLLILIKFAEEHTSLRDIKTIYTIHNLAMQGVRPFDGDESSFKHWFPDLHYSIDKIIDPRYSDCVNPMRAGILLCDRVQTVSPTYAKEILQSSDYDAGLYGGDGLENDLKMRDDRAEVFGILNGCEYPEKFDATPLSQGKITKLIQLSIRRWAAKDQTLATAHWLADSDITSWGKKKNIGITITSIGRLTEQKVRILNTPLACGKTALQGVLDELANTGTLIMLGSGNPHLEAFLCQASAENQNFIFLNGYSDEVSKALYNFGDLFLMPSSFEPCGISQMLAMRSGQPCIVNAVGGLKDTVSHDKNGFVFSGDNIQEQAQALVDLFKQTLALYKSNQDKWLRISKAAKEARFTWKKSAKDYLNKLI
ncbi:glycogen synthase [Agarilytica rhodophyticola]|uniref:glycogen synthase n=1 Tax=Agarilytica rhodophyticola TaxID=1737490 RepID=UPI001FE6221C|nr:glycogen/starch synthase [Agarilytica rhodophyticola]